MNRVDESTEFREKDFKEVISGGVHFPICRCGKRKEWLIIRENRKKIKEIAVCPSCNPLEIMRVGPTGKVTFLKMARDGAFSLGK